MRATISTGHYPNVVAVSEKLSSVLSSRNQLIAYAKACVKPAYDYFETKCNEDLAISISMFKCAHLFHPSKMNDMKPTVADVDTLRLFPFLDNDVTINGLKRELPVYLATSEMFLLRQTSWSGGGDTRRPFQTGHRHAK